MDPKERRKAYGKIEKDQNSVAAKQWKGRAPLRPAFSVFPPRVILAAAKKRAVAFSSQEGAS
jgi:hypothetical protein